MTIFIDKQLKTSLQIACSQANPKLAQMIKFNLNYTFSYYLEFVKYNFDNISQFIDKGFQTKIEAYQSYIDALKNLLKKENERIAVFPIMEWINGQHKKEIRRELSLADDKQSEKVIETIDGILEFQRSMVMV